MAPWIFQALFNILLVNVAFMWLLSRKRTRFLEAQLDRVEREVENLKVLSRKWDAPRISEPTLSANPVAPTAALFTPGTALALKSAGSQGTLVEKRVDQPLKKSLSKAETAEAYDRASVLLAKGMSVREIARLTGLSLAELQLMGKVSQRSQ